MTTPQQTEAASSAASGLVATIKAAPAVAVSAVSVAGMPIADLVYLLTAVYTILQIIFLLRDRLKRRRGKGRT